MPEIAELNRFDGRLFESSAAARSLTPSIGSIGVTAAVAWLREQL